LLEMGGLRKNYKIIFFSNSEDPGVMAKAKVKVIAKAREPEQA